VQSQQSSVIELAPTPVSSDQAARAVGWRIRHSWLDAVVCLLIWAAFMPSTLQHVSLVRSDRTYMIEATESLVCGRGIMQRPFYGVGNADWVPMTTTWPPGYPVMLAALHVTGISAYDAGWISDLLFGASLVLLISWFNRKLLPRLIALPVTLCAVLMPTFLHHSANGTTDIPFAALTVASLACLLNSTDHKRAYWWLFGTGFFAGAAYTMRWLGLALFPAEFCLVVFLNVFPSTITGFRRIVSWGLGTCVCALPMTIYFLVAGHEVVAYEGPVSGQETYWEMVRLIVWRLLAEMTTSPNLAYLLNDKYLLVSAVLMLGAAALYGLRRAARHESGPLVILGAYLSMYMVTFVVARTKYGGAEDDVNARFFLPIYWILWIVCAYVLSFFLAAVCNRLGINKLSARVALACFFAVVALLQLNAYLPELKKSSNQWTSIEDFLGPEQAQALAGVDKDKIILSSWAAPLRVYEGRNARNLPWTRLHHFGPLFSVPTRAELQAAGDDNRLWGIVIMKEQLDYATTGAYGEVIRQLVMNPTSFPEFELIGEDPALMFRYRKTGKGTQ
jgi:4-amino-4-deoxy-L-arabinose transferase-like glycosyltransferase